MGLLHFVLFFVFVVGAFIYFSINPMQMLDEVISVFGSRRLTLKDRVILARKTKKRNSFLDVIASSQKTLTINNKGNQFLMYCAISLGAFFVGILVGLLLGNPFAMVTLAICFAYSPFLAIRFMSYSYQRQLNGELETALSVITTAYQHNEDLFGVIEANVSHIKDPLSSIFKEFLFKVEHANISMKSAIQMMSRQIDNRTWNQWCDTLILCQEDKTMRSALFPIVHKFSDIRIVSEDLSYALYDPLKELAIMCSFLLLTPVFIYFASVDWFDLLWTAKVGQCTIALNFLLMFVCLHAGVMHSKPVSY